MNKLVGSSITVVHGGLWGDGGGGRIWEFSFLIFLKSELFGLWENLGKCLVCVKIWESENEMLFGCFVVILLWNGGL